MKEPATSNRHVIPRQVLTNLLINIVAPLILYALISPHLPQLQTLMIIALVPLAESVVTLVRRRRLDAFGIFILITILIGAGIVALGGSPRLILAREQIVTGVIGIAFLLSLLTPYPLMFYLLRPIIVRNDPDRRTRVATTWSTSTEFRRFFRLMTLVFGIGIVLEAIANLYLAFAVSIPVFLATSPIVRYTIAGALVAWLVVYTRLVKRSTGRHPLEIFTASSS